MRRVSSRQRFVSWDAFDATTAHDGNSDVSSDTSDYSDHPLNGTEMVILAAKLHATGTTVGNDVYVSSEPTALAALITTAAAAAASNNSRTSGQRQRKRGRGRKHHGPAQVSSPSSPPLPPPPPTPAVAIPSFAWEMETKGAARNKSATTTNNKKSTMTHLRLESLLDDVQLHILSFLDLTSVRSILCLNHKYRALVLGTEGATADIWMPHFAKRWPMMMRMMTAEKMATAPVAGGRRLVDAYSLPTATGSETGSLLLGGVNLPLLLSMTPERLPTEVDQSLLDHSRNRRSDLLNHPRAALLRSRRSAMRITQQLMRAPRSTQLEVYQPPIAPALNAAAADADANENNSNANGGNQTNQHAAAATSSSSSSPPLIRYTGPIGSGDRCIRANFPLPRPFRKKSGMPTFSWRNRIATIRPSPPSLLFLNAHPTPAEGVLSARSSTTMMTGAGAGGGGPGAGAGSSGSSLFELLCQGARAVSRRGGSGAAGSMPGLRPFVAPHWQADGSLDVTPSFVAYYEVDILEPPLENNSRDNDDEDDTVGPPMTINRDNNNTARGRRHPSECVAVGIATESFHVHTRMPGWDSLSFGYHGDDGGIFHSSGGMVERFGPTFGVGDTVGCGIDYVAQGIFFTLNGEFLGYGWKNIGAEFLQNDLYPVVGIDTNAPISLNLGGTSSQPFKYDLSEFHEKHAPWIANQYQFSNTTAPVSSSNKSKMSPRRRLSNSIRSLGSSGRSSSSSSSSGSLSNHSLSSSRRSRRSASSPRG